MPQTPIDGVQVKPLKPISDERGTLTEILRSDEPMFRKFGQVYVTTAYPGAVKGWHYHKIQWDNFTCVRGMAKLVLYDGREGSPTRGQINEFFIGPRSPQLVAIPPAVYHGFTSVGVEETIMMNVPTEAYRRDQPDEFRLPWNDPSIPYDWTKRDG